MDELGILLLVAELFKEEDQDPGFYFPYGTDQA